MPKSRGAEKIEWWPEEKQACQPPEKLTIAEWAEKYRVLKKPVAEEEGPLKLRRTPYLVPVLNCLHDDDVETVVLCKSAQIAGTEGMISVIGYYSHQEPCAIMLVLADEDTALYMSKERIQKMYRDSAELSKLIIEAEFNQGEMRLANGSYVVVAWASSVAKLASRPMRIVICDEIDKPGYYVPTKESNPTYLARQRTEAKYNRKILMLSTPTEEGGNITRELNSCDVIYDFHVPCPFCGQRQPLRWSKEHCYDFKDGRYRAEDGTLHELGEVVWEGGLDATHEQIAAAGYRCGECGMVWNTIKKNAAVEQGKAVPRTEFLGKPRKVGFHVNRLYSLLGHSGDIPRLVDEFMRAKKSADPRDLQGFINNALAEPWVQAAEKPRESDLLALRCSLPPLVVPAEAVALTAGIDVQKIGFYYTVWAWTRNLESWLIDYGFVADWEDVRALVFERQYEVEGAGQTVGIWRAAIDTGGGEGEDGWSRTEEIYDWLRMNGRGVVHGVKGMSQSTTGARVKHSIIDRYPRRNKPIPGGLVLWLIDTDYFKDAFFWRMRREGENDPQRVHFHSETGMDFIGHLLAEEKRRNKRGLYEWVRVKRDNHWLDATTYAASCADAQWAGGVRALKGRVVGGAAREGEGKGRRIISKGVM